MGRNVASIIRNHTGLVKYPMGVLNIVMNIDIKRRALHRSRIIEGQFRGLAKAINSEDYCIDILTQSLAIQKSLGSLSKLVLENHLRTHISEMMNSGDPAQKETAIAELLNLYELHSLRGKS